ncbi:hypothetical protein HDU90_000109 [Geranomyces variabilis]|nr:hypothetical protein HDU90_000109 [Geranomyces variabilis]
MAASSRHASRRSSFAGTPPGLESLLSSPFSLPTQTANAISAAERPMSYSALVPSDAEAGLDRKLYAEERPRTAAALDALPGRRPSAVGSASGFLAVPKSRSTSSPQVQLSPALLPRSGSLAEKSLDTGAKSSGLMPPRIFEPDESDHRPSFTESAPPMRISSPPPPDPPPLFLPSIAVSATSTSSAQPAPDFVFVVQDDDTQTITERGTVAALPKISVAKLVEKDDELVDEVKTAKRRVFDLEQDVQGLTAALAVCEADDVQINQAIRTLISEILTLLSTLPTGQTATTALSDRLVAIADGYSKDAGASVTRALQEQAAAAAAAAAAARSISNKPYGSTMAGFGGSTMGGLAPKRVLRGAASRLVMGDGLLRATSRMGSAANLQ